jgi:hypothetical protein
MYTTSINPRASVLGCCSPLQLLRTPELARSYRYIGSICPSNPLISRVLTPFNLNEEFSPRQPGFSRPHNNSHVNSHNNVSAKFVPTSTPSATSGHVPPKPRTKKCPNSHINITPSMANPSATWDLEIGHSLDIGPWSVVLSRLRFVIWYLPSPPVFSPFPRGPSFPSLLPNRGEGQGEGSPLKTHAL